MKKTLYFTLCLLMVFCLGGCGNSPKEDGVDTSLIEEEVTTDESGDEGIAESTEEPIVYAEDEVVNQFISDYNAITQSEFTDINEGYIRIKYSAYSYGYYCELLNSNATNKIVVTIKETNDNAELGVAGMRDIFHDVALTIDPSLSDETVYKFFDEMVSSEYMKEGILGSMIIGYIPDKENSRGHIKISAQ